MRGDAVCKHAVELEDARFQRGRQTEHGRADRAEVEARQGCDKVLPGEAPEQAERCRLLGDEGLTPPTELAGRKIGHGRSERRVGRVERRLPGQR